MSSARPSMDGVRQQEVVVADLEGVLTAVAVIQKRAVPAVLPPAVADLGNTDPLPVIAAEAGRPEPGWHLIQVRPLRDREKGKVLVPHGLLQGNAGSENENGSGGPQSVEHDPGHEIGVGFSNAGSGVAEGDAAVPHGLQHPVDQGDLLRALRHPLFAARAPVDREQYGCVIPWSLRSCRMRFPIFSMP